MGQGDCERGEATTEGSGQATKEGADKDTEKREGTGKVPSEKSGSQGLSAALSQGVFGGKGTKYVIVL
jgi:hypothetical protein